MPKKKEPPLTPEEQRRRFEALARRTGAGASAKQLREAVKQVARSKPDKEPKKKDQ